MKEVKMYLRLLLLNKKLKVFKYKLNRLIIFKMVYIYVLKLENNKYYVGKTSNPSFRMESHFNENGSAWTRKYKPIKLEALIPDCDDYDEDKYTKKYMDKYGINNVRGGSFVTIELDENTIEHLTNMSNGTNDKCFRCGRSGHFASSCYARTNINGNYIHDEEDAEDDEDDEDDEDNCCFKCGRPGHYASNCYARTDVNGNYLKRY
jgi:hypothetical protein